MVLSLSAKWLTTGEISAHLHEVYGTSVSKDTISASTDRVLAELAEWRSRPLDAIYPVIFIDADLRALGSFRLQQTPVTIRAGATRL